MHSKNYVTILQKIAANPLVPFTPNNSQRWWAMALISFIWTVILAVNCWQRIRKVEVIIITIWKQVFFVLTFTSKRAPSTLSGRAVLMRTDKFELNMILNIEGRVPACHISLLYLSPHVIIISNFSLWQGKARFAERSLKVFYCCVLNRARMLAHMRHFTPSWLQVCWQKLFRKIGRPQESAETTVNSYLHQPFVRNAKRLQNSTLLLTCLPALLPTRRKCFSTTIYLF